MGFPRQKILEWVAISFSRGSSRPRDRTCVFSLAGRFLPLYRLSLNAFPVVQVNCCYVMEVTSSLVPRRLPPLQPGSTSRAGSYLMTWEPQHQPSMVGGSSMLPSGPFSSVQFSSVAQSCPTFCDPMDCSTPGLPVHQQLPEFTQTHVH